MVDINAIADLLIGAYHLASTSGKDVVVTRDILDKVMGADNTESDRIANLHAVQTLLAQRDFGFVSYRMQDHPVYLISNNLKDKIDSAGRITDDHVNQMVRKQRSRGLAAIRDLADLDMSESLLTKSTCSAIGHSRIGYVVHKDGKTTVQQSQVRCVRCGASGLKSLPAFIIEMKAVSKTKPNQLKITGVCISDYATTDVVELSWRDVIHVPGRRSNVLSKAAATFPQSIAQTDTYLRDVIAEATMSGTGDDCKPEKARLLKAPSKNKDASQNKVKEAPPKKVRDKKPAKAKPAKADKDKAKKDKTDQKKPR
jgi:hypothetical protein